MPNLGIIPDSDLSEARIRRRIIPYLACVHKTRRHHTELGSVRHLIWATVLANMIAKNKLWSTTARHSEATRGGLGFAVISA